MRFELLFKMNLDNEFLDMNTNAFLNIFIIQNNISLFQKKNMYYTFRGDLIDLIDWTKRL